MLTSEVSVAVSKLMKTRVADPALRREVEAAVRRRVRGDEAEDVVQATLADLLSAAALPEEPEEFRRFVFGVARNKVFDHFRRQKRQADGLDEDAAAAPEPPLSARDILRWAEGELPDAESQSTLEWMLREGDGEKLEHIARDAKLPATRVRKRVSRLRKFLRERWAAELMLAGLLALLCALGALYWYSKGNNPEDFVKREPARPLPSIQHPEPHAPEPSRPAGNAEPIPNLVAPPPSATPAPKLAPVPTGLGDLGNLSTPPRASGTGKPLEAPKPSISRKHSSIDSSFEPAPETVPDFTDSEASPSPTKANANVKSATKPAAPSKARRDFDSSHLTQEK